MRRGDGCESMLICLDRCNLHNIKQPLQLHWCCYISQQRASMALRRPGNTWQNTQLANRWVYCLPSDSLSTYEKICTNTTLWGTWASTPHVGWFSRFFFFFRLCSVSALTSWFRLISHAAWFYGWQCWTSYRFGPAWNISTMAGWITKKSGSHIHGSLVINYNDLLMWVCK